MFEIEGNGKYVSCPNCGKRTKKRQDLKKHKRKQSIKHLWFSDGREIRIKPVRRYFRCCSCKRNFLEKFDFEATR